MRNPSARSIPLLLMLVLFVVPTPRPAMAQSGYKFHPPAATLSFRMGAAAPRAHGEIYKFFTTQLTLQPSDFRALAYAGDLSVHVASRFDLTFSTGYDQSTSKSEFQDWVDQDNKPIEQTTKLRRVPLSANAKIYLLPPGRRLAKYAWVANQFTPYVILGGGVMYYKLVQDGDWVDTNTLDVFSHRFVSSATGGMVNAGAGTEVWLTQFLAVNAEARYAWGSARLGYDFDFDNIDLSGFQLTTGLAVRF